MEEAPAARGWIFPPDVTFDEPRLLATLAAHPEIVRLKGVFRTVNGWVAVNRRDAEITLKPTAYRRDSRVEVFAAGLPGGWGGFEAELLACRTE